MILFETNIVDKSVAICLSGIQYISRKKRTVSLLFYHQIIHGDTNILRSTILHRKPKIHTYPSWLILYVGQMRMPTPWFPWTILKRANRGLLQWVSGIQNTSREAYDWTGGTDHRKTCKTIMQRLHTFFIMRTKKCGQLWRILGSTWNLPCTPCRYLTRLSQTHSYSLSLKRVDPKSLILSNDDNGATSFSSTLVAELVSSKSSPMC